MDSVAAIKTQNEPLGQTTGELIKAINSIKSKCINVDKLVFM